MTHFDPPQASDTQDFALDAVRALVLYSVAEFQAGHASTIRVTAKETSFSIADDGRGHAIDRSVADAPYLKFIYTHLDYPFESGQGGAVQLQGIGMSLVNTLCSELVVTVRKANTALLLSFTEGQHSSSRRLDNQNEETGNTIAGTIKPQLQAGGIALPVLHKWLLSVLSANPSLRLFLNEHALHAQQSNA